MAQGNKRVSQKAQSTSALIARMNSAPKPKVPAPAKINVAALGTHAVTPISAERLAAIKAAIGR